MHARVRIGEAAQTFSFWAHGDERLTPGGGLFVDEGGLATNHHFVVPLPDKAFSFCAGTYAIDVFADVVGRCAPTKLCVVEVALSDAEAAALLDRESGVMFEWGPDSQRYVGHVKAKLRSSPRDDIHRFLEAARHHT